MKKIIILMVTAALLSGCTMNKVSSEEQTINLRPAGSAEGLTITITTGDTWSRTMKAGPFIFNVLPQFVIWTEGPQGEFGETLYLTGANGKMRHAKKNELGADFYRQALPVWASRAEGAGQSLPSKENNYPDTVTSATPTFTATMETLPPAEDSRFLYLEINQSTDGNESFPAEGDDWIGQPSLIYRAALPQGHSVEMTLLGRGNLPREEPGISEDVASLTSALKMVSRITVRRYP